MSRNVRRKKHKIIKTFGILVAFVLVIGTTVAITLALLNKQTDTTINTFTGNKQLDLDVREPDWDGKGGNSYTSGDPRKTGSGEPEEGQLGGPIDDGKPELLGENKASNYTPGMVIKKNPYLVNKTETGVTDKESNEWKNACEYVAIKLEYQVWRPDKQYDAAQKKAPDTNHEFWETVSYDEFVQLADIYWDNSGTPANGFSNKWTVKADAGYDTGDKKNTVFYYNEYLTPYKQTETVGGDTYKSYTDPLFNSINVKQGLDVESVFMCDATSGNIKHYYKDTYLTAPVKLPALRTALGASVTIDQDPGTKVYSSSDGTMTTYYHVGLIPFRINVTGYAVQAYVDRELIDGSGTGAAAGIDYKAKLLNLIEHGNADYTP